MSKQQRTILIVAAGAVAVYVLYRWYSSRSGGGGQAGAPAGGTAGADYAQLAGQEQADTAALANQEASDISNLGSEIAGINSGLAAAQGQEAADVAALTGEIAQAVTGPAGPAGPAGAQGAPGTNAVAATHTGEHKATTITTHTGGPFYNYYVKVTGHPPPLHLTLMPGDMVFNTVNWVYENWKAGTPIRKMRSEWKKQQQLFVSLAGANSKAPPHPPNTGQHATGRGHQAPGKTGGAVAPNTHETKPKIHASTGGAPVYSPPRKPNPTHHQPGRPPRQRGHRNPGGRRR